MISFSKKEKVPTLFKVLQSCTHFLQSVSEFLCLVFLPGEQQTLTKVLSPFDDSVDKNPVVRSMVLKLLLKYR